MGTEKLQVVLQEDGDVCVAMLNCATNPNDFQQVNMEFCTLVSGGGKSPNTLRALRALALAIQLDSEK